MFMSYQKDMIKFNVVDKGNKSDIDIAHQNDLFLENVIGNYAGIQLDKVNPMDIGRWDKTKTNVVTGSEYKAVNTQVGEVITPINEVTTAKLQEEIGERIESGYAEIGDDAPDNFDAMFADMAEEMVVDLSEVKYVPEHEEPIEEAPGFVMEEIKIDEPVPEINKEKEELDVKENPQELKVVTASDKIRRGLLGLGKKVAEAAKGILGRIANAFNSSASSSSSSASNAGQGVNMEEKPSQTVENTFGQHVELNVQEAVKSAEASKGDKDSKATDERGDEGK